jgi:hypothetical protein
MPSRLSNALSSRWLSWARGTHAQNSGDSASLVTRPVNWRRDDDQSGELIEEHANP